MDLSLEAPSEGPSSSLVMNALTPRAIVCAILLGTGVCLTNMYFGLQAGLVNAMPMQSALLGFAIFRSFQSRLSRTISPPEMTVIEIIAGSLGLAPFTSGFTSFIPALEFLTKSDENGPIRLNTMQLLTWSVASCGLGIIAAAPFRTLFILRERLRFPSATATGTLIGALFKNREIIDRAKLSNDHSTQLRTASNGESRDGGITGDPDDALNASDHDTSNFGNGPAIRALLYSFTGSVLCVSIKGV